MFIITKATEPHHGPVNSIESTVVRILTNHKTNHRKYLAVHWSHSASTGRFGSSFRGCVSLVVGALLSVLFSQIGCSRSTSPFAKSQTLSPVEIFQRVSPSVFVVEALDEDGKTLMLGSGVAMARDFLVTNCHVVQSGSSLRVSRARSTGPRDSSKPHRVTIFVDSGPAD
jgi:S1-C subfamily serine protease